MAVSGNGTYDYTAPNINASSVSGKTVNGVDNVGGYQMPDYTSIAKTNNTNAQNFSTGQSNQVGAFQGAMQSAVNALPTYQQLNEANNQQYNVQPLMQNATNLNNQLLRLPSENYGMTQGSDTNQAQLDQMTGVQQFRLQPLAQNATAQAQQAQTLSNQATGYGVQNENFQISPYTTAAPMVQSQMASAATGFYQAQSDQLTALEQAVQSGAQLSGQQLAQLTSLQNQKTAYDQAVATSKITNQNQQLAAGTTYYNPTTGQYYNPTTKVSAPT
jgi:hypothetical protein